jgi:hypothetical protein
MKENELLYILNDIICDSHCNNLELKISDNEFIFKFNNNIYSEKHFDFNNPNISDCNIIILNELSHKAKELLSIEELYLWFESNNILLNFPVFQTVHFFANEFYLDNNIPLDKHDRIRFKHVKTNFHKSLEIPIVDVLSYWFLNKLNVFNRVPFVFYISSDMDVLNLWKAIGFKSFFKRQIIDFLHGNFHKFFIELRSFILSNKYWEFNPMLNMDMFVFGKSNHKVIYRNYAFWLLDYENKKYDIDNNFSHKSVKDYIEILKEKKVCFGLHPSYNTIYSSNGNKLSNQIIKFNRQFCFTPTEVRFHYLHFRLPEDVYILEKNGISTDHTFTFVDSLCFRGGVSKKFKMWNFTKNRPFNIYFIPLTLMDGTLNDYLNYDLKKSIEVATFKINLAKEYGNLCSLLWHNRSMYKFGHNNNIHHELYKAIRPILVKLD